MSKTTITPVGGKIIIVRDKPETVTKSGLILPQTSAEAPMTATIHSVGEGLLHMESGRRITPSVRKGQRVVISKWAGVEVKIDDQHLLIINEDDILAIVE